MNEIRIPWCKYVQYAKDKGTSKTARQLMRRLVHGHYNGRYENHGKRLYFNGRPQVVDYDKVGDEFVIRMEDWSYGSMAER